MLVYVLVAIIEKRVNLKPSRYTFLQGFSVTLFEKIPSTRDFLEANPLSEEGMIFNLVNF